MQRGARGGGARQGTVVYLFFRAVKSKVYCTKKCWYIHLSLANNFSSNVKRASVFHWPINHVFVHTKMLTLAGIHHCGRNLCWDISTRSCLFNESSFSPTGDHDGIVQGPAPLPDRAALTGAHVEQMRHREEGNIHLRWGNDLLKREIKSRQFNPPTSSTVQWDHRKTADYMN